MILNWKVLQQRQGLNTSGHWKVRKNGDQKNQVELIKVSGRRILTSK